MNGRPFFDTNVLIYAVSKDDPRSNVATSLLQAGGSVSVQVLNEFVAAARRKYRMTWDEIEQALKAYRQLCPNPVPLTIETHESAVRIAQQYKYRIYDSLVIATALWAACDTLYSEDLQDGQVIQSLTIRNPFKSTVPASI